MKLPIIGLLIGAGAAIYLKSKKKAEPEPEVMGAAQSPSTAPASPAEDTSPPA